jgi:hypothetical protein
VGLHEICVLSMHGVNASPVLVVIANMADRSALAVVIVVDVAVDFCHHLLVVGAAVAINFAT